MSVLDHPLVRTVGIGNLIGTAFLGTASFWLVASQPTSGGALTYPLVLLAVLPLLILRRHPVAAPWLVATATLLAQLLVGPLVTCGVVFPTIFVIAFQLGSRLIPTTRIALGGLGVIATILVELLLDPVLGTADAAVFVFGLGTTFFVGGLLLRSRVRMVEDLRRRTAALAEQRDRTAAMAVAADRERIGADLELAVRPRVTEIATTARQARLRSGQSPESGATASDLTTAALAEIEELGRLTLTDMRAVVGTLRDAPTLPPPGLSDLDALLHRVTGSDRRLEVEGDARSLGPNIELAAYRIVEQLLATLADDRLARIHVTVTFAPETLQLRITGPARSEPDRETASQVAAALAAACTRAEVSGGHVVESVALGRRQVEVVLPLPVRVG